MNLSEDDYVVANIIGGKLRDKISSWFSEYESGLLRLGM